MEPLELSLYLGFGACIRFSLAQVQEAPEERFGYASQPQTLGALRDLSCLWVISLTHTP